MDMIYAPFDVIILEQLFCFTTVLAALDWKSWKCAQAAERMRDKSYPSGI